LMAPRWHPRRIYPCSRPGRLPRERAKRRSGIHPSGWESWGFVVTRRDPRWPYAGGRSGGRCDSASYTYGCTTVTSANIG